MAAHLGLTPRRFQSGEMGNPGRISRAGDPQVRATLYTAAHPLMTRSTQYSSLRVSDCGEKRDPRRRHQLKNAKNLGA